MSFADLGLSDELLRAVADSGYGEPTPIQQGVIPSVLMGRVLVGGVQMGDQVKALEKGVDVLIATPGRLMDLFSRGKIMLNDCSLLVIDEADRMLDMGFIPDIEEICSKLPKSRQTLLFSATMPPPIQKLASKFLNEPKKVEVARPATANINIEQRLIETRADKKRDILKDLLHAEEF